MAAVLPRTGIIEVAADADAVVQENACRVQSKTPPGMATMVPLAEG
jgi:hypothetical protein